jgi:hypothetical protein
MSPNDLLTVLFVFIAANIALIVAALIMSRVRRRRGVASVPLDHAATAGQRQRGRDGTVGGAWWGSQHGHAPA